MVVMAVIFFAIGIVLDFWNSTKPVEESAGEAYKFLPPAERVLVIETEISEEAFLPEMHSVPKALEEVMISLALSAGQMEILADNGFVAGPGMQEKEFYIFYEKVRYANLPVFVTTDSLLHTYHLLFGKILRSTESGFFLPMIENLLLALLKELDAYYHELSPGPWRDAALTSVAYVSVAGRLAADDFPVPDYAAQLVEAEITMINNAAGIQPSPVLSSSNYSYLEDYSQYIPRGHYTYSEELGRYFKCMMWLGRITFRLETSEPEIGRAETRSVLLIIQALRNARVEGVPALQLWENLYEPITFLVGQSDDLTVKDYLPLFDKEYGRNPFMRNLSDENKLDSFIASAIKLPPPRVLGLVIDDQEDYISETKGLRLMAQRFTPDAYIFDRLTYRNVGTREQPRALPSGLDLFAAMGSDRAYSILDQRGDTAYENYNDEMEKLRTWTASLHEKDWKTSVYGSWLHSFYPLLEPPAEEAPSFMHSPAWLDKQLHTCLGSWAELKHDTILYGKQTMAEMGEGEWFPHPPRPEPARGYVEPVPLFYSRLAELASETRQGMQQLNLLSPSDAKILDDFEDLARFLEKVSEKQLKGEVLSSAEHKRIRLYGGELENLLIATLSLEEEDSRSIAYLDQDPQAAVIADVATDHEGINILEVGIGRINEILVVVPLIEQNGTITMQVAKGGIFSYYEFPWPASDRLTDEKWREILDAGSAPNPPDWIDSFYLPEHGYLELQEALKNFHSGLVSALYYQRTTNLYSNRTKLVSGKALEKIENEIDEMIEHKEFEARKKIGISYRSFDRQASELVVVTVRETWRDKLYGYPDRHPYQTERKEDMIELGTRGPYDIDITYTFEWDEEHGWVVSNIVTAGERPAW